MTLELPLWMQANKYPARLDRLFIQQVMRSQQRVFSGLAVSQRAAGADFTIDVSAGYAAILCTSQADGGMWFTRSTAVENRAVPTKPGSGTRTDLVIATVNDPNAGGAAGDNWVINVISGTTLPANSIPLARINRSFSEGAVLNAAIIDVRPLGEWSWTVSTVPPTTTNGVPGDLWVVVGTN